MPHPRSELLAHEAAQRPHLVGVGGADHHAHLQEPADRVGDDHAAADAVPQVGLGEHAIELRAHPVDVDPPVEVEVDRAEQGLAELGPVLERGRGEVGARQHEGALIPHLEHDVAEGDLADLAPLALHDDDVAHADGLAEGELHAGEQVAEDRLRRKTGDDRGDAGRRENARSHRTHFVEGHENGAQREDHDHRDDEPADDLQLRARLPRREAVALGELVALGAAVDEEEEDLRQQPGGGGDQRDGERVLHPAPQVVPGEGDTRDDGGDDQKRRAERPRQTSMKIKSPRHSPADEGQDDRHHDGDTDSYADRDRQGHTEPGPGAPALFEDLGHVLAEVAVIGGEEHTTPFRCLSATVGRRPGR